MKYLWLALFCTAPLWAQSSAKELQGDINLMGETARTTYPYQQVYALGAEVFADEGVSAGLKIEFAETITLPTLDIILRHFNEVKGRMGSPEGKKLAKMNILVVEKLKEAHALYLRGLKEDNPDLKARANAMAAVEASALAAQAEEYSRRLQKEFDLAF